MKRALFAALVVAASALGCTDTPEPASSASPTPPPTQTARPALTTTPDLPATQDAERFTATIQAYQTETASGKATERAGGLLADSLQSIGLDNFGRLELVQEAETKPLFGAAFVQGGRFAALLSQEATVIYDLGLRAPVFEIPGEAVTQFALSPNGTNFAAGLPDGRVLVWRSVEDALLSVETGNAPILTAAYFRDGAHLAAGSAAGDLTIIDPVSGSLLVHLTPEDFPAGQSTINRIAFSPNGEWASIYFNNLSSVWVGETGSLLSGAPDGTLIPWLNHAGPIADVLIDPTWAYLAWISRGTLQVMTIDGELVGETIQNPDWIQFPAFLPDAPVLLFATNETSGQQMEGLIRAVDLPTGRLVYEIPGSDRVTAFAVSPDGSRAAAGFNNGEIRVLDARNGAIINRTAPGTSPVIQLAFHPEESLFAALDEDGLLTLHGPENHIEIMHGAGAVYGIQFDAAGNQLVIAAEGGRLLFYGVLP